ncbi:transporter [Rhizobium sp. CRIBSB]|nr:transporter [Rhizobium sp. CRIBSB]
MTRVAILTPDPADSSYAGQWPRVLQRAIDGLAEAGLEAVGTSWTDHISGAEGLRGFDLVLPIVAWGYHRDHRRWLQACETWQAANVAMANPASVLAWNSDKAYLRRLSERGIAIPRTIWTERVSADQVAAAFDSFDVEQVIVKPTVSGGAWRTLRLTRGQPLVDAPTGAAMIQPYLSSIETKGETSLLFFGGRLSHAVNKRPVPGEFRIQVQFGGLYDTVAAPSGALALAEQVLAAIEEPLLYARIDMARDRNDNWVLMEAELIEPDFYLANDPARGAGFAAAVAARLGR